MKLSEFIYKNSIFIDVQADSQKNVFKILGNTFSKKNKDLSSLIIEKLNENQSALTSILNPLPLERLSPKIFPLPAKNTQNRWLSKFGTGFQS